MLNRKSGIDAKMSDVQVRTFKSKKGAMRPDYSQRGCENKSCVQIRT